MSDFAKPENIDVAVQCLNELITNALGHIPDIITYLSRLRNQSVFNFCAIPQVGDKAVLVVYGRWRPKAGLGGVTGCAEGSYCFGLLHSGAWFFKKMALVFLFHNTSPLPQPSHSAQP